MTARKINFKKPLHILHSLDTALKMEKEKYKGIPVGNDMVPMHDALRAWSYVVSGYFLVEQSFKGLLVMREKKVPQHHSLTRLFKKFDSSDKEILREYYADFRSVVRNGHTYPYETLEDFLANLDGDSGLGSFDWRYILLEEPRSDKIPYASVEFLHEVAYGAIRIIHHAYNKVENPSRVTISWRKRWKRKDKFQHWLTVRMNSEGWEGFEERLEILWGPDYRGRYDMLLFRGNGYQPYFAEKPQDFSSPIVDKRKELEEFDIEDGYRGIGEAISLPKAK